MPGSFILWLLTFQNLGIGRDLYSVMPEPSAVHSLKARRPLLRSLSNMGQLKEALIPSGSCCRRIHPLHVLTLAASMRKAQEASCSPALGRGLPGPRLAFLIPLVQASPTARPYAMAGLPSCGQCSKQPRGKGQGGHREAEGAPCRSAACLPSVTSQTEWWSLEMLHEAHAKKPGPKS